MRKFIINVNGSSYEVEVEEVFGARPAMTYTAPVPAPAPATQATAASTPAAAPAPKAEPAAAPAPVADNVAGTKVVAPMPGTILDVRVNVGDSVKKGTVLLILEAMKMENEILAAGEGKVAAVSVQKGDTVSANQTMVVIA